MKVASPAPAFDINFQATVFPSIRSLYAIPANSSEQVVIGGSQLNEAILIEYEPDDSPGELSTFYPGDTALDIPSLGG